VETSHWSSLVPFGVLNIAPMLEKRIKSLLRNPVADRYNIKIIEISYT
jgi:hypothetical protein